MNVFWTPEAERDRDQVWERIAAENPRAAVKMDELLSETAANLARYPMLGHAGRAS